ncbi:polysaccharide biosynthesis protein [Antarcticibacterium flavum]|uniref:Polysaccharide biosynthesis protein n=1 Tax=Antarcticibacterium flavum TaxID=2058175 RepID=A0A5B7WXT8_9FLAO|nr:MULTISPECIES: polysaccharide biosynthesis protein [Antarcticibacterium]MCM4160816.1 polysaccharide biosynthesis protein [Antarcticibacterium sp. W02-3]QCY67984.1 polysaccharide biosynthesis protein [Antarcticibacterium flavum]
MYNTNSYLINSIKGIKNHLEKLPYWAKLNWLWHWGKLISITGAGQTIVQIVGFVSGILIIRLLPVEEYAFYTLGNTILGTMVILADGGIATGVTSIYGRVWETKNEAGRVVISGLELRKKFALLSLLVGIPILFYLLIHHNASWHLAMLMILSLIPAFFSSLSSTIYQIPLLFHQEVIPLQKNQLKVNVGRLILLFATVLIFPWAFVAILAGGIPQIWGNLNLKKISINYLDWGAQADPEIKKKILVFVKRILPGSIYYCFSGQITLWLISIFGSTENIAQLGALGRLAMILTIIAAVFNTLAIPGFVKLKNERWNLFVKYSLILMTLMLACVGILLFFTLFQSQALWILGDGYSGLEYELVLFIASSCIELLVGISFALNSNRGWLINPYLNIVVGLLSIVVGVLIFDISSLRGILYFKLFTAVIAFLYFVGYGFSKISRIDKVSIIQD